jgi:serine/threonine protein kinase
MSLSQSPVGPGPALEGPDEALALTAIEGPLAGQAFRLAGHCTFLVGRGPAGVQFALEGDPGVSRTHFLIEYNPPHARLVDLHSKNGTYVNGQRVTEAPLNNGDVVRAGLTSLHVSMPGGPATRPMVTEMPTPATTDMLVPGYRLVREVARGGMGVVYQAKREADGEMVAVKMVLPAVSPRPEVMGRFQREMSILQRLSHPNIVRFLDTGESGRLLYFVMEYVEGQSAAEAVKKGGAFAPERVVALGCQLLEALAHAHLQGFIHRDVKPGNILLTTVDGRETVKLADFGLARTYQASMMSGLTISGQPGGTPGYMPPEQVLDFRSARPSADQYAAAATLYYLLTGQMIYEADRSSADLLMRVLNDEPKPLRQPAGGPSLPGQMGQLFCRALARDPQKRYPDVLAFRDALARAL